MEELFCIGCGAQIQTEDKEKAGFTPASTIKKAITMRLWMSTSLMMNF